MNISIRAYQHTDFEEICKWWVGHHELPPIQGMMIENGTFILENDHQPVMTLTAFMTQSKEVSYIEGYCAKPGLDSALRRTLGEMIWEHCFQFLRSNGFKRALAFTDKPELVNRYKKFGMIKNMDGLSSLGRELCLG